MVGCRGIEINPQVWPANVMAGSEVELFFWHQQDAGDARPEPGPDVVLNDRERDLARREGAVEGREEAIAGREAAANAREGHLNRQDRHNRDRADRLDQRGLSQDRRGIEQDNRILANNFPPPPPPPPGAPRPARCTGCGSCRRRCLEFFACKRRLGHMCRSYDRTA